MTVIELSTNLSAEELEELLKNILLKEEDIDRIILAGIEKAGYDDIKNNELMKMLAVDAIKSELFKDTDFIIFEIEPEFGEKRYVVLNKIDGFRRAYNEEIEEKAKKIASHVDRDFLIKKMRENEELYYRAIDLVLSAILDAFRKALSENKEFREAIERLIKSTLQKSTDETAQPSDQGDRHVDLRA